MPDSTTPDKRHVFVSYAWSDGATLARQLHDTFNARDGWSAWMDVKLHADTVFTHELQMQIDRADLVVVVVSPAVNRRNPPSFVQRELAYATQPGVDKPVFVARAEDCPLPLIIANYTYQNFFGDLSYDDAFARLLERIHSNPRAVPDESRRDRELAYLRRIAQEHGFWSKVYVDTAAEARVRPARDDTAASTVTDPDIAAYLGELMMAIHPEKRHSPEDDAARETVESFDALTTALAEFERVAIIGDPGSGKTTTLRRFAYDLADTAANDEAAPLPIFVPLGGFTGGDLGTYIAAQFGGLPLADYLPERAVVLLDGLNETAHTNVAAVQRWLDANPAVRVLLTCRKLDYVERKLNLQRVDVLPLDVARIQEFMQAYKLDEPQRQALFTGLGLAGEEQLRAIWDVWQREGKTFDAFWFGDGIGGTTTHSQDEYLKRVRQVMQKNGRYPGLLGLVRNPFLLTVTIAVYLKNKAVPRNRGQLLTNFVRMLFTERGHRAAKEAKVPWYPVEVQQAALGKLAYRMQREKGQTSVDSAWARGVVAEAAPEQDPDHLLYLAAGAGIIEKGAEIRFTHQLLQEYFAADGLGDDIERGVSASEFWPGAQWWEMTGWEETVLLLAGIRGEATEIVRWLTPINPVLAYRCATESGVPCTDEALRALHDPSSGARLAPLAVAAWGRELATWGDPRPGVLAVNGVPDIAWGRVPAGVFRMGGDPAAWNAWDGAEFDLPYAFWIAQYPVTVAQYAAFVEAGGYAERRFWTDAGWQDKSDRTEPRYRNDPQWHLANHPVIGVSWYEAYAFTQWLNELPGIKPPDATAEHVIRLPRECEWEKAARYPDGRLFPWGNEWDPTRLNWAESGINRTSAVGMFLNGANPAHGAHDLSGHVWEWCLTEWRDTYESPDAENNDPAGGSVRCARGGSWVIEANFCRAAARYRNYPDYRSINRGFRVVMSVPISSVNLESDESDL